MGLPISSCGGVAERLNAPDCKSGPSGTLVRIQSPPPLPQIPKRISVAKPLLGLDLELVRPDWHFANPGTNLGTRTGER